MKQKGWIGLAQFDKPGPWVNWLCSSPYQHSHGIASTVTAYEVWNVQIWYFRGTT